MEKYVITTYVEKFRLGQYVREHGKDVLYHREEVMEYIDQFDNNDTYILQMSHNYEVEKEDIEELFQKLDNADIELYVSYNDGKSLLKVII